MEAVGTVKSYSINISQPVDGRANAFMRELSMLVILDILKPSRLSKYFLDGQQSRKRPKNSSALVA